MNQKKNSQKPIEIWSFIRYGVPIAFILDGQTFIEGYEEQGFGSLREKGSDITFAICRGYRNFYGLKS